MISFGQSGWCLYDSGLLPDPCSHLKFKLELHQSPYRVAFHAHVLWMTFLVASPSSLKQAIDQLDFVAISPIWSYLSVTAKSVCRSASCKLSQGLELMLQVSALADACQRYASEAGRLISTNPDSAMDLQKEFTSLATSISQALGRR